MTASKKHLKVYNFCDRHVCEMDYVGLSKN